MSQIGRQSINSCLHVLTNFIGKRSWKQGGERRHFVFHFWVVVSSWSGKHAADCTHLGQECELVWLETHLKQVDKRQTDFLSYHKLACATYTAQRKVFYSFGLR